MQTPSSALCRTHLFQEIQGHSLHDPRTRAERSYLRAEAIANAHALTAADILSVSSKFWKMHTDPIVCLDGAATTLLTIQYNLVIGTLSGYMEEKEGLDTLINELLEFKKLGQFCLTEVEHGLDVFHMRTTATLMRDGTFDLHTPDDGAAKIMPPTVPVLGRTCIALVFARLIVGGEFRGIRPFVVTLNDGISMCHGISARLLPYRGGSAPVNHSITSFNHVKIPSSALLGDLEAPDSIHLHFLTSLWRVSVGALCLASTAIPSLQISSHIAFNYSRRRMIHDTRGTKVSILSFRTQEIPVYTAVSQAYVLDALHKQGVKMFLDGSYDPRVSHGVTTCLKAVMIQQCQASLLALSERCGAQGLFNYNQITSIHSEIRGIAIAEGDILVLSIRLASELLLGRYSMPPSTDPNSLLSRHEQGLLSEYRGILIRSGGHRSQEFSSLVLPHCQAIVEAIGHRMAYDAAVIHGVPQVLIDLYVCNVVKLDFAWYTENKCLTRADLYRMEDEAICSAEPFLARWVDEMAVEPFVEAPIVDDKEWCRFIGRLPGSDNESFVYAKAML